MAKAADTANTGIQRGRGGFYRTSNDVPYVSDPSGATMKHDGTKAELIALCFERGIDVPEKVTVAQLHELLGPRPKRIPYGSPSNFGKRIENTTNLVKWGERRVVLGIGTDPELVALCGQLVGLDVDSDEYKELADTIIIKAKDAAEAGLAADRGTFGHALSEDFDEGRDWLVRLEAGEQLGLDAAVQAELVRVWREMLERNGLEVLVVEASVIDDHWRLAGTLDRIVRTTRELRFALVTGEVVTIPVGTVLVLDIKSGRRKTDDRTGAVIYWQAYATQIASYAQSVPYDTATEQRGEWPFEISQEHALIAHLDVLAAIDGNASCELVYVDLVAGREHGGACVVSAKAWEQRTDVFSVAQLDAASSTESAIADETTIEEHDDAPAVVAPRTPKDELDAVCARPAPDEGGEVVDPTYDVLQKAYLALGKTERAWITALTEQAMHGGVSFHSRGHRTLRRYEIIRGLVALAGAGFDDDQLLRAALHVVIGDVAHFTSVPAGHLVGSLSAKEAAWFSIVCDRLATAPFALVFTDDGHPMLRTAA